MIDHLQSYSVYVQISMTDGHTQTINVMQAVFLSESSWKISFLLNNESQRKLLLKKTLQDQKQYEKMSFQLGIPLELFF